MIKLILKPFAKFGSISKYNVNSTMLIGLKIFRSVIGLEPILVSIMGSHKFSSTMSKLLKRKAIFLVVKFTQDGLHTGEKNGNQSL